MIHILRILLWCSELELALTKKSPIRNPNKLKGCEDDVSRWSLELFRCERPLY